MTEPVRLSTGDTIKLINSLNTRLPENNPSIFMKPSENDESKIDNDFIFKHLYS